jgi:hypothetical protein
MPNSPADPGYRYGNLYSPAPTPDELDELRRQQAEFDQVARQIDIQNSWMAVPSLAPIAAVFGLETAAAVAARFAPKVVPRGPLVFPKRDLRGGDFWATRIGREADKLYKEMARAKNGWTPEPRVRDPDGKLLKPDLGTPPRTPDPKVRNYIEVKPNTPSGRAAAARQIKKYEEATGRKVRALFYDPKRFM